MERSAKVWLVCAITVGGLATALFYHGFVGLVLGAGFPSNTFLYDPAVRFGDYYDIFGPVQAGHPLSNRLCPYFPFAYASLYALAWLPPPGAVGVTIAVFAGSLCWFFWQRLSFLGPARRTAATAILAFATYPFIFCADRGNLEMVVLVFLLGFFVLYERGQYMLAGLLLAGAIAMKLHPGVFGVLLLLKRQYKASVFTAVATLALTLIAAALLPDGFADTIALTQRNIRYFSEHMVFSHQTIQYSSSYFSLLKLAVTVVGGDAIAVVRALRPLYVAACLLLFASVALYILVIERRPWKQAALLTILMILLTDVSFDYKLIYLLLPVGLFLAAPAEETRREDLAYAVLFGLCLIPKAYAPIGQKIAVGVVINPMILTLIASLILYTGIRRARATVGRPLLD